MRRFAAATVSTALAVVVLNACGGGSDTDEYCDAIESTQGDLSAIDTPTPTNEAFSDALSAIQDIADKAPSSSKDDWQTVADKLAAVQKALEDAGMNLEDLTDPSKLGSADPSDMEAIQKSVTDLGEVQEIASNLQTEVKEDCNIDLS